MATKKPKSRADRLQESLARAQARLQRTKDEVKKLQGENLRLKMELEKAIATSLTDPLTGLNNRRAFEEFLSRTLARAGREGGGPVVVVYADLDQFSAVNNTHGHPVGDQVLVKFAEILRTTVRPGDFCGRLSGGADEFAIILPMKSQSQGEAFVARLSERVKSDLWVKNSRDEVIRVNASFGFAEWREGESVEQFLDRVDSNLYIWKEKSRRFGSH